jgi:hypothetical protein
MTEQLGDTSDLAIGHRHAAQHAEAEAIDAGEPLGHRCWVTGDVVVLSNRRHDGCRVPQRWCGARRCGRGSQALQPIRAAVVVLRPGDGEVI